MRWQAAVAAAHEQEAALIIVVTHTGIAGRLVVKYRPKVPVLLSVCESHRVCRQAYLCRGLIPMVCPPPPFRSQLSLPLNTLDVAAACCRWAGFRARTSTPR